MIILFGIIAFCAWRAMRHSIHSPL
jgi:hypothetical protein